MSDVEEQPKPATLPRVLGPWAAFSAVVGSVIGSGIFLVAAKVTSNVPFLAGIVLVWLIGGIFSGAGALTLAELGAMLPQAGGLYVFLRAAYGSLPAFLFGWAEFLVVRSGSMATLAAAFAQYFAHVAAPPKAISLKIWEAGTAMLAIAVVSTVNVLGARRGGTLQVIGTALKVGGIATLITLPFLLGGGSVANFSPFWPGSQGASAIFKGMMTAMVSVLWAYDGWTNVTPIAEEIRDPGRNIPRALIVGMAVLIAAYLGMTLAYHYVLPMSEIKTAGEDAEHFESAVAALYCHHLLGRPGVIAISLLVMCSTFIALNGNALAGPRAYFAMSRDGLFPKALCRVHPTFQTPANAIIAQAAWAILLIVAGTFLIVAQPPGSENQDLNAIVGGAWTFLIEIPPTGWESTLAGWILGAWKVLNKTPLYDVLYTYVIFGALIFYMLAIAGVFVLRARHPELPRPYRTLGYPVTPLLFVASVVLLLGNMLIDEQTSIPSLVGLGIIAAGVPAYWFFRRSSGASAAARG